ncbi:MAG: NAD(P)H-dependent oxidoreductase [Sphingomonadales bacterium]|jgi:FMN-dependent NADH-azoreductase|nr:NAD(P)H-dependent oxidoreductase [Sphingomonadales bacterium]
MIILHVDSSITAENSVTRSIGEAAIARLSALHPHAEIRRRDLASEPLGHMTLGDLGDTSLAEEFLAADVVVIGAPMYNFSIPSNLKAWMDRLAIAGTTFRYTDKGAEGLAGGRKLIIASARGGFYGSDTERSWLDHQETYLRGFFGFLGVTDIAFVRAEGIAMGPEARAKALEDAKIEAAAIAA